MPTPLRWLASLFHWYDVAVVCCHFVLICGVSLAFTNWLLLYSLHPADNSISLHKTASTLWCRQVCPNRQSYVQLSSCMDIEYWYLLPVHTFSILQTVLFSYCHCINLLSCSPTTILLMFSLSVTLLNSFSSHGSESRPNRKNEEKKRTWKLKLSMYAVGTPEMYRIRACTTHRPCKRNWGPAQNVIAAQWQNAPASAAGAYTDCCNLVKRHRVQSWCQTDG